MNNNPDANVQSVMMALDQLSETLDVMRQVVERLRRSVDQAQVSATLSERQQHSEPQKQPEPQKHPERQQQKELSRPAPRVEAKAIEKFIYETPIIVH